MSQNLAAHIQKGSRIVFVDGACALCNRSSHLILQHDTTGTLLIASLQSALGQEACRATGQDVQDFDRAIFLDQGVFFQKSSAILRIGLYFPFFYRLLAKTGLLVPKFLRDWVYDGVARNRHGLNRRIACRMPPANLRSRILD